MSFNNYTDSTNNLWYIGIGNYCGSEYQLSTRTKNYFYFGTESNVKKVYIKLFMQDYNNKKNLSISYRTYLYNDYLVNGDYILSEYLDNIIDSVKENDITDDIINEYINANSKLYDISEDYIKGYELWNKLKDTDIKNECETGTHIHENFIDNFSFDNIYIK